MKDIIEAGVTGLLDYESVFAHKIVCQRYDCGSELGYLQATIDLGIKHPEIGNKLLRLIRSL